MHGARNSEQTAEKSKKVTITLDKDLLDRIDNEVESHHYSNRSNAIETLLRSFLPKIDTAFFLLSGKNRVFEKTRELPFILSELRHLMSQGIKQIIITYNQSDADFYQALIRETEELENQFKGSKIIVDYTHVEGGDAAVLGTTKYLPATTSDVLVVHGTVLRENNNKKINIQNMYQYHLQYRADITLLLGDINLYDPQMTLTGISTEKKYEKLGSQSHVMVNGPYVTKIYKPVLDQDKSRLSQSETQVLSSSLVDLGFYIVNSTLIEFIRTQIEHHPEKYASFTQKHESTPEDLSIIEKCLADKRKVVGYMFSGYWNHFKRSQ